MRAASLDFETARLLGVRANRVIGGAVLVSGALAAVVAVMLTVQNPLVTPDFALQDTIVVLAGVVLGGLNRPIPATLGGLLDRLRHRAARRCAADRAEPVPAHVHLRRGDPRAARPARRALRAPRGDGAAVSRVAVLAAPCVLVVATALLGSVVSGATGVYFITALVNVSIVVALYVFIGNSGVLSFGHISFVAIGVWTAGVLSVPTRREAGDHAEPRRAACDTRRSATSRRCSLAALVGGVAAVVVGLPLMRLSGLAAGIATFARARDHAQPAALLREDRAGPEHVLVRAGDDRHLAGGDRRAARDRRRLRLRAQPLRPACCARPARTRRAAAAAGVSIYRQRLLAFALSGAIAGFAGGLYVHLLPLNTEAVYLDLTFITLAMLVIGGATSLWGAVVGALAVSALDSFLAEAENGVKILGVTIDLPAGTRVIVVGALMALVLIVRPTGLTDGREFALAVGPVTRVCVAGPARSAACFAGHLARVAEVSVLTRRGRARAGARTSTACASRAAATSSSRVAGVRRPGRPARARPRDPRVQGHRPRPPRRAARRALPRRDGDDGAERARRRGDRRRARRLAAALRGHVHERHAALRHARRVRARHGDLDRPVPRRRPATTRGSSPR